MGGVIVFGKQNFLLERKDAFFFFLRCFFDKEGFWDDRAVLR